MKRRSFLQLLGLSSAVGVVPQIAVARPVADKPVQPETTAVIREISQYNIRTDQIWVRHEILIGPLAEQIHVTHKNGALVETGAELKQLRRDSLKKLQAALDARGFDWRHCKQLPLPAGVAHARNMSPSEMKGIA